MIYSIFALFIQDLGATRTETGLVFSLGSLSAAVAGPLFGRLSDKIGRKPVILASMVTFSVTFILYSLARSYIYIYFIQLLEGVGWAALGSSAVALIMDVVSDDERGKAIGLYNTTWNVGWIMGPALGGFLAERIGFHQTFLIAFFLVLIGFFSAVKFIKVGLKPSNIP
jgi:MFS family permease